MTHEGFAKAWQTMTDEAGFADRMNGLPKYVASTTPQEAEWNASVIKGDVTKEVAKLKQQPDQNLLVAGSGAVSPHADATRSRRRVPLHGAPGGAWKWGVVSLTKIRTRPRCNSWTMSHTIPASSSSPIALRTGRLAAVS